VLNRNRQMRHVHDSTKQAAQRSITMDSVKGMDVAINISSPSVLTDKGAALLTPLIDLLMLAITTALELPSHPPYLITSALHELNRNKQNPNFSTILLALPALLVVFKVVKCLWAVSKQISSLFWPVLGLLFWLLVGACLVELSKICDF